MSSLFEIGVSSINQAVKYDANDEKEKALDYYRKGISVLLQACRFEKNPYQEKNIKIKCIEYLDRAEKLKQMIKKTEKPLKASEGGDVCDNETDLRRQLLDVIVTERPTIKWEDVAGLDVAKDELRTSAILPLIHPNIFSGKRQPWSGILLFGPPGTGKSFLAKAVASQCSGTFLSVSSSDLVSKWQGESARLVKELFTLARERRPTIIFIDEIDSLCGSRDNENQTHGQRQVLTEILVQMDGVGKDQTNILVLGATNTPWDLDPAIRRRFQKRIFIPLPDEEARAVMFTLHFGIDGHELEMKDFRELAKMTDGFSGSDIANVAYSSLHYPIRLLQRCKWFKINAENMYEPAKEGEGENVDVYKLPKGKVIVPVFRRDMIPIIMQRVKKTTAKGELIRYEEWMNLFGESGTHD